VNAPDDQGPVARREVDQAESVRAARSHWDADADRYQADHGSFLGDAGFLWCPEGLTEAQAGLLGDVRGRRILEVGCGAAQCSRWLTEQGAITVGIDISLRQLQHARRIDQQHGVRTPVLQADAGVLPFADDSFDIACSAFGAIPFVADSARVMTEIARVLRPGGRFAFSISHPVRWMFLDDPGERGLRVETSYFDRRAYVEQVDGRATYVEQHRTFGDRVREIVGAGLVLEDVIEPEWTNPTDEAWGGGWSRQRAELMPGTAIFVGHRR
jgi:SAM-dependent methyltransferase